MAQSRHGRAADQCPLSGVKQTSACALHMSAIDPKRTFSLSGCVDCGEEKDGEYYTVANEVWAASGLAPHGGMLCLACLERRIGRLLVPGDFTALWPSAAAWQRHLAARVPAPMTAVML